MATAQLDKKRDKHRAQVAAALQEEEDPLAAYDSFVKWTIQNYPDKLIARSGLLELLEEATRQFKDDTAYKGDLRYLKLWSLYASHVEDPSSVYAFVIANNIGTVYAQIYEEYAVALAGSGRPADAEKVFQLGIQRRARPLERLKKRYSEFQANGLASQAGSSKPKSGEWADASPETQDLRRNPLRRYLPLPRGSAPSKYSPPSSSSTSAAHTRYAHIRAPPVAGRRPEKLQFNLSLLFTEDNVEYSVQEARARSMGLLGKKWGPPPPEPSRRVRVDDDMKGTRNMTKRGVGFSEPTVTLATKEALADVFGMYNSPEKSMKFGTVGSKHAPVRKVEPVTPMSLQSQFRGSRKEDGDEHKTPNGFRPYVDQGTVRKENSTSAPPPTLDPFLGDTTIKPIKPPTVMPGPTRRALTVKDPSTTPAVRTNENEPRPKTPNILRPPDVQQSAFTPSGPPLASRPLSRQDIFTDDAPELSKNNVSQVEVDPAPAKLTPFVDPQSEAPFKVFSRPPSAAVPQQSASRPALQALNASGPSRQPFVPARSALAQRPPLQTYSSSSSSEDNQEHTPAIEYQEEFYDESTTESEDYDDAPVALELLHGEDEEDPSVYDDDDDYSVPLGGRLGHVNVMTPITERTFEFTTSTRSAGTSNDTGRTFAYTDPVESAEQLAAELREEDGHEEDEEMGDVEERTGTLNLSEAITAAARFNPPNPCNPFDPSIMSIILSLIPADPTFYDLRQQESGQLDALQKFAKKKTRRNSGNTSMEDSLLVTLFGRSYGVVEKLGEGGFGAVFEAIDVQAAEQRRHGREDSDDSEEDEEETPKVALKVVKPRNLWEFRVLRRIHSTLSAQLRRSIITPSALYAYRDESFLVMEYCNQGTLLNVVNNASKAGITQQGACLDELLVVFFTIELMRLLEGMHKAGFIHGDVKVDNCLIRLEDVPSSASAWSSVYQPSGEGGWSCKGIKMIDFGRTIDTRLFPSKQQQYTGDWPPDARDCLEMREGKPWTYQTDYFGLAGIIYCMLYGKYIEASSVVLAAADPGGQQRYKLSTPFKRYWQVDLWTRLFDLLLNSGSVRPDGHLPLCEEMEGLRKEMESWLQTNCNRGSNSLKGLLKKIGLSLLQ